MFHKEDLWIVKRLKDRTVLGMFSTKGQLVDFFINGKYIHDDIEVSYIETMIKDKEIRDNVIKMKYIGVTNICTKYGDIYDVIEKEDYYEVDTVMGWVMYHKDLFETI